MIVLIGLSAKNSILIVEYAKMRVDNGRAILPALIDTVKVRLRPILMTAFSTVIGAVPLAWASGAGSGSRISIGTAIIGGMMSSTLLSIFLVPVLFLVIEMIFHPDIPVVLSMTNKFVLSLAFFEEAGDFFKRKTFFMIIKKIIREKALFLYFKGL